MSVEKLTAFVQDANREIFAGRRVKQIAMQLAGVTDAGGIPDAALLRELQDAVLEYGRVALANLKIRESRRPS